MTESLQLLGGLIAAAGLVLGGIAYHRSDKRRRNAARRNVASACDLTEIAMDERGTLTGRKGQLGVTMCDHDWDERGILGMGTRFVIDGLLPELGLARAGPGERVWRALGARALGVGDPVFDSAVQLQGPPLQVRALFDATTRSAAREALEAFASLRVEGGRLTADCDGATGGARPRLVASDLQILLDLGRRLRPPETPASRLAQIAHADPVDTVRALALRTLTEVEPRRPEANEALRVALRDASPALRLQAARALGDEGASTLLALADDFAFEDAFGAEAMAVLGDRFTIEQARPILVRMAIVGRVASAWTAIEVVARGGDAEVPTLARVLASASEPIAAAAATALGTIASPSAMAPLLTALRAEAVAVAVAAARALGACATAAEIAPLREAETRAGELGRAAREAIAAIQSRLSGASPGQVSLASGDAGQLSVAESGDGRVSLRTDE